MELVSTSENYIGPDSSLTNQKHQLLLHPFILPKGKVILKPQMTRQIVGSLADQQFVFGQVRSGMGMESSNHHLVDNKSKDVLNFIQLLGDQNLSIQK